jgi:hypothetical protein
MRKFLINVQKTAFNIFIMLFCIFVFQRFTNQLDTIVFAGEVLSNIQSAVIPKLKESDGFHSEIYNTLKQLNEIIKITKQEDFVKLAEHPIFIPEDPLNHRIFSSIAFNHKKIVQLNCYRTARGHFEFFEPDMESHAYNVGYLIYFSEEGFPLRYLAGEFSEIIEAIQPQKINFVKGIDIKFHNNGVPSEYRKIEKYRPQGQQIKWDKKGIIVSENIAAGNEIIPEFEQILTNHNRYWGTKDQKFWMFGKFISLEGDIAALQELNETEKTTTIEFSELRESDKQRIKDLIKLQKNEKE